MKRESFSPLVRIVDRLIKTQCSDDNILAENMERALMGTLNLMRLRFQVEGIKIPDAISYLGGRLEHKYGKQGKSFRVFLDSAVASQPEVYKHVLPYVGVDIAVPKTYAEDLFISDLIAAKTGQLSETAIDSKIQDFLFSEKK